MYYTISYMLFNINIENYNLINIKMSIILLTGT